MNITKERMSAMYGSNAKEERKRIFEDTKELYESNEKLVAAVKASKEQQKVILESDNISVSVSQKKYDQCAKVTVSKKRSLEAAMKYANQRVCVHNFASASNPGGGVVNGSNAQEEAICRCSTLYPCISEKEVVSKFHARHKQMFRNGELNSLYNDDCIYTPDVVVFKSDTAHPELLDEKEWCKIDVISCAAPNLRPPRQDHGNNSREAVTVKPSELLDIHMKRMRRILDIAKEQKEEVLILGAFGCGAFQNSPEVVAEAMARILKEYLYDFKAIEFAVYCSPKDTKNYDVFNRRLSAIARR